MSSSSRAPYNKINEGFHRDYIKQSHTHSSSTSTATADDEDFINMDGSSSFQTSTNSPNKAPVCGQGPDISGLKFYSHDEDASNRTHANFFRKSIVVSPSWREVKSQNENFAKTEGTAEDTTFSFDDEVPTRNLELVISPSLQQLSDILTSKVNHSQSQMTPLLENPDELDNEIGLVGNLGSNRNQSVATFYTARTLNTVASDETYQLSRNISVSETPDLIDLSSPVVEESKQWPEENILTTSVKHEVPAQKNVETSFLINDSAGPLSNSSSQSHKYKYTDIFEHYSPERNPSTRCDDVLHDENPQDHINNRNSVLSEQLTLRNIQTPKFGNIFENNDSVHEFGYDREDSGVSDFSFVPSTKNNQTSCNTAKLESPFVQSTNNRFSMRIVQDEAEEVTSDAAANNEHFSFGLTPAIDDTTNEFVSIPKLQPPVEEKAKTKTVSVPISPLLSSPMNPPSPTMEQYKKTLIQEPVVPSEQSDLPPQKSKSKSQTVLKPVAKNENSSTDTAKLKKGRLTFKSLFKKNETKAEVKTRISRPKSFSFGTMENENNKKPALSERKEKSMSLLSSWKRRSMFNSTTNVNKKEKKDSIQMNSNIETPKSPNKIRSMSFSSLGKLSPKHLSPHKHSQSAPLVSVDLSKNLPNLPSKNQINEPLLATYGLDSTPVLGQSFPVNYEKGTPELVTNSTASPSFEQVPKISKSASLQRIQTASTENMQQAQSATLDFVPSEKEEIESMEKVIDLSFNTTYVSHSSTNTLPVEHDYSVYETSNDFLSKPPKIQIQPPKTPTRISTTVPIASTTRINSPSTVKEKSPVSLAVASFTTSPNRFHIGDDLFPKHLGIDEIESIVTLERSRSMRSVKSGKINKASSINSSRGSKKSISQLMQDHNSDFEELLLPDGSILVKSPSFSYDDFGSISKPSRTLKPLGSSPLATKITDNQDIIDSQTNEGNDFEELQDLINMINFDNNEDVLDTNFDIDMNFNIELSPLRKSNNIVDIEEKQEDFAFNKSSSSVNSNYEFTKDSSVPDFLANNSTFDMDFDDLDTLEAFESPVVSKVSLTRPNVEYIAPIVQQKASPKQRQVSRESVEEIIKKEEYYTQSFGVESNKTEDFTPNAYLPEYEANRPTSLSFKGLKGPSFNNALKPATQSAILGSVSLLQPVGAIVPSDSENSFGHYQNNEYGDVFDEIHATKKESYVVSSLNPSVPEVYEDPFTTNYTRSYDDLAATKPSSLEKTNKFMQKLSNNEFGHFSTASLPTSIGSPADYDKMEKSKKLLRKKNKSVSSFGKIFGVKEEGPKVQFSSRILLYETYGEDEYDREPDVATCNNLTPKLAMEIKAELNDLKSSMPIHESSKCYTHFF